jgi:amidohydrolase
MIARMPTTELLAHACAIQPQVVELRRTLHRHPEVGLHLPATRDAVVTALGGLPVDVALHTSTSGVTALLEGTEPGPTIILRGDMDALPMPEDTGLEFASEVDGAMHACGHDLHTAMLAGAVRMLASHREGMPGRVLFMFQPGEEGQHGARYMLEEGLLDSVDPRPTGAFALHVTTTYASGTINHRAGSLLASADEIHITVTGRGGHASAPHHALDPITIAAEIILATQAAVTRQFSAFDPIVVTFGRVDAGTTNNVIPETASLIGTMRTHAPATRTAVQEMVERVAVNVAAAHTAEAALEIIPGYPVTMNDAGFADLVTAVATTLLGEDAVQPMDDPIMGAEDWSYVLEEVPGAMAFLGARPPDLDPETAPPNHSNRVVFDENAMPAGVAMYASVALDFLRSTAAT